jgi:hypothetical protein
MSVPQKYDAKDLLSENCDKGRFSFRLAVRADKASPLEIAPERPQAGRLTFVEDFILEHSLHGLQTNSIGIAGSF